MRNILTICLKDLRLLLRDRAGLFFTFAFPVIYALFFGMVFSSSSDESGRRIPLRLVDLDSSAVSTAFLDSLAARPGLQALRDSLAGATTAVRRGRASAALILQPGFGEAMSHPFAGVTPEIEILHDPARQAEAGLLQGLLMEAGFKSLARRFQDPRSFLPDVRSWRDQLAAPAAGGPEREYLRRWAGELDRFLVDAAVAESLAGDRGGDGAANGGGDLAGFTPLKVKTRELRAAREGPQSSFEITFPQGLLWGVISVAASFGLSLIIERKEGTLRRLRAAPLRRRQILAGKALACFSMVVILCVLLLLIGWPFGVGAERPALLGAAILSTAFAFTGIMLLISVLGKTERAAGAIGWSLLTLFAMLGGGMVPLFFMPEWMRTLGHVSPVKWSILALEGALWRGFSWAELLPVCAILLAFGAAGAIIGLKAFRWSDA